MEHRTRTVSVLTILLVVGLVGVAHASLVMGNEAIARGSLSANPGDTFCDTNNPASVAGTISAIEYYSPPSAGTGRFAVADADRTITWVSEELAFADGLGTFEFDAVQVSPGSNLCVWSETPRSVMSSGTATTSDGEPLWRAVAPPVVGLVVSGSTALGRTLSMNAVITPSVAPTKGDCKDGGWAAMGRGFRNQGECISSVTANERAGKG